MTIEDVKSAHADAVEAVKTTLEAVPDVNFAPTVYIQVFNAMLATEEKRSFENVNWNS
jgi:hypothetical protein